KADALLLLTDDCSCVFICVSVSASATCMTVMTLMALDYACMSACPLVPHT
ncbi:hypothetical protein P7K49_013307, partial [Saguinus oedipus]